MFIQSYKLIRDHRVSNVYRFKILFHLHRIKLLIYITFSDSTPLNCYSSLSSSTPESISSQSSKLVYVTLSYFECFFKSTSIPRLVEVSFAFFSALPTAPLMSFLLISATDGATCDFIPCFSRFFPFEET